MKRYAKWMTVFAVLVLTVLSLSICASAQEIPQVKPEELKKLIENGDQNMVIIDVQPKGAYDMGHVKGAINFPWAPTLKSNGNLPKDKTLILYCDCAHEEDSTDVATQLKENWGYMNIKLLEGGWSKWREAGYPMEKNK
jgi:sulfur-carrier protein adenylyltransferase/sulfurtransferase